MSFISSFEITKVVIPEPLYIFFCVLASIAKKAAVRPNKPSGFMTDFNKRSPVFNNGPRRFPRNSPD